jgi:multiple sugar transport system permease protein
MFNELVGPINYTLKSLGIAAPSWLESPLHAFLAILIADTWQWTPFTFILILAGLQNIDEELYQAARVDGANFLQSFFRITLPLVRGTIFTTAILRSMDAFRVFGKVFIMTSGGPGRRTEVMSMLIVKTAFDLFEIDFAAALVSLLLVALGIVYFFLIRNLPWMRRVR